MVFDSEWKSSSETLSLAETLANQMLESDTANTTFELIYRELEDEGALCREWSKHASVLVKPSSSLDEEHLWGLWDPDKGYIQVSSGFSNYICRSGDPNAVLMLATICAHEFVHALVRVSCPETPPRIKKAHAVDDVGFLLERHLFAFLRPVEHGVSFLGDFQEEDKTDGNAWFREEKTELSKSLLAGSLNRRRPVVLKFSFVQQVVSLGQWTCPEETHVSTRDIQELLHEGYSSAARKPDESHMDEEPDLEVDGHTYESLEGLSVADGHCGTSSMRQTLE